MEAAMSRSGTTVLLATALTTAISLPLAAQQPRAGAGAPPGTTQSVPPGAGSVGADISDATVQKTGAALGQIAAIRQEFAPRIQAAPTPEQRQGLAEQASRAAAQAISAQGLSVDEYQRVIQLAEADQGLRERVLAAARAAR
jgi:hypothetical protein